MAPYVADDDDDDPEAWRDQAACREWPTAVFFAQAGPNCHRLTLLAKEVCRGCCVQAECLEWAVIHRPTDGIFGGTAPKTRDRMRKQRGISKGRAFKQPRAVAS